MRYYIIAGEASGDLHGSNLMKGIYSEDPHADIRFWGGDCMNSVWSIFQNNPSHSFGAGPDHSCCRRLLAAKVHRTVCVIAPDPCGQGGSTVFPTTFPSASKASARINVTDNSGLGLPRAVVRMACSKGTYVRAFARDLGEALGSGAHLDSLQRSRSGEFRVEDALTVDQAIALLRDTQSNDNQ